MPSLTTAEVFAEILGKRSDLYFIATPAAAEFAYRDLIPELLIRLGKPPNGFSPYNCRQPRVQCHVPCPVTPASTYCQVCRQEKSSSIGHRGNRGRTSNAQSRYSSFGMLHGITKQKRESVGWKKAKRDTAYAYAFSFFFSLSFLSW